MSRRLHVDELRPVLDAALARRNELEAEIREAAHDLEKLVCDFDDFDPDAAGLGQLRVAELKSALALWARRAEFLNSTFNTCDAADHVTLEEVV